MNILHEPNYVESVYNEYFKLINYYHNIARQSIFIKYYNINLLESTVDDKLDSTYDYYHYSKIQFDTYDLTPVFLIQPVTNRSTNVTDLTGSMLDATTSIIIYTIKRPKINDLITFYKPIESDEIFRVTNISVPVNAIHASTPVNWYELELEYAPVLKTSELRYNYQYVYDLSNQKYVTVKEYTEYITKLNNISKVLKKVDKFYNSKYDCYMTEDGQIPIFTNEILLKLKKQYSSEYKRLFDTFKSPFGYLMLNKYINDNFKYNDDILFFDYLDVKNDFIKDKYQWVDKTRFYNSIEELLYLGKEIYNLSKD